MSKRNRSGSRRLLLHASWVALLVLATSSPLYATEGAAGRPITGLQVMQYGAIVPPHPGWVFALSPLFYTASLGGNVQTPIAGQLALNVDVDVTFVMASATRIWGTKTKQWNFASGVSVLVANTDINANVVLGNISGQREDSLTSLYDTIFIPLVASYHISQVEHVSFNLTVWAPTGHFEVGRLSQNSMNVWTFVPTVAYTRIWPASNLSLDVNYGVGFYTENPDTDYKSAPLSNLDVMVTKKFKNGFGIGGVFGWIQQYGSDEGGLAGRLDGFKGRALGIGPSLSYSIKTGNSTEVSFTGRVLKEFENKNRPEGYPILFSASFVF